MKIPGLGAVTNSHGSYHSEPIPVPVLGGKLCTVIVYGYDGDLNMSEFHTAISNFLSIGPEVLRNAEKEIYRYYKDMFDILSSELDEEFVIIETQSEVWKHICIGNSPVVSRRPYGDKSVYVSLECECAWEEEHGLQIVFKNGLKVNKVGPFDGHLTNSDAYADDSLEEVLYVGS
jgi:hypothetical protein